MRPICEVTPHIWGLGTSAKENQSSAKLFSTISESQVHPIVLLMVVDATWWQQLGHRWRHLVDELVAGDHLVILCQRPRWSRLAAGNLELSGNFGPLQPAVAP